MTFLETLAWSLGLLAFARLVLAPLGDYLSRRYVAADSWSATEMNTISASAPPRRIRPLQAIAKASRKLGNLHPATTLAAGVGARKRTFHFWRGPQESPTDSISLDG